MNDPSPARPAGNRSLQRFGTSIFTEMTALAQRHDAVNLGQGFPDFDGPQFIKDAAAKAMSGEGLHQYCRPHGLVDLTTAIAEHQARFWQQHYDPLHEITVHAGATEAICASILGLCNPGDEVLIFAPFYDSYRACIAMAGAHSRCLRLQDPHFRIEAEALEAMASPKLRLVVFNQPHNPSGRVFDDDELSILADFCRRHDLLVVCDEVYEHLVFDGRHRPLAKMPGMSERCVTISSAGKTFSLTGWKVGHSCAPRQLSAAIRNAHQFITFCTPPALQHALVTAYRADDAYFDDLRARYRERRDLICQGLRAAGLNPIVPEGSYFVLTDIRQLNHDDDLGFCRALIRERGVAAIPCSSFYDSANACRHLVRWAFCKTHEQLQCGLDRLQNLERLRSDTTTDPA